MIPDEIIEEVKKTLDNCKVTRMFFFVFLIIIYLMLVFFYHPFLVDSETKKNIENEW